MLGEGVLVEGDEVVELKGACHCEGRDELIGFDRLIQSRSELRVGMSKALEFTE